jgi:hypothetical protein
MQVIVKPLSLLTLLTLTVVSKLASAVQYSGGFSRFVPIYLLTL